MKKRTIRALALAWALTAAVFSQTAYAEISPSFARSSEEWARLRDNRLEWNEIPDLVHEYNTTVVNNWIQYTQAEAKGLDSNEYADKLREDAQQAYDDAVNAEGATDASIAQADMAYKNAMAAADAATVDGEIVKMTYQQTEAGVTAQVQAQLVGWYTSQLQLEADRKTADYQQKQYDAAVRRRDVGQATALDVLTAEESMKKAQAALITDEAAISKAKQTVLISLGWKYNAEPEMCAVPIPTSEELAAMDLAKDTQTALETNYALRISTRKRANAQEAATKDQLDVTIKNTREQVQSDMTSKFRAVTEAQAACAQDDLNVSNLQNTYDKTARSLALGSASARELETAQYNLDMAKITQQKNDYALAQAYLNYQNAANGLAANAG